MRELIHIQPAVLAWAIDESGFSSEQVAQHLNVSPGTFKGWLLAKSKRL
jgi:orotate phosphoribosyltransferase-like protein